MANAACTAQARALQTRVGRGAITVTAATVRGRYICALILVTNGGQTWPGITIGVRCAAIGQRRMNAMTFVALILCARIAIKTRRIILTAIGHRIPNTVPFVTLAGHAIIRRQAIGRIGTTIRDRRMHTRTIDTLVVRTRIRIRTIFRSLTTTRHILFHTLIALAHEHGTRPVIALMTIAVLHTTGGCRDLSALSKDAIGLCTGIAIVRALQGRGTAIRHPLLLTFFLYDIAGVNGAGIVVVTGDGRSTTTRYLRNQALLLNTIRHSARIGGHTICALHTAVGYINR